jgi:hypothetical protein
MPNSNISMVVTSCGRHDLLRSTLESFYQFTDIEPQQLIIVEDSDAEMPEFLTDFIWRQRNLLWLGNGRRIGQIYAIDRAYAEVKHDFIFHCEDDWKFVEGDFIMKSKRILEQHPEIIQVSLRGPSGWHPLQSAFNEYKGLEISFFIAEPYWRGGWGGLSFNPGLRRTADYKKLGSYGRHASYGTSGLGHEFQLSKTLLDAGYRIADLGREIVVHTGGTRSMAVKPLPPMPKLLIAVPACFKFEYGRWESEQSPSYNQSTAWEGRPYGTDIHISGDNDRIAAIRDTWAKDVSVFPYVTLKFFYGKPPTGYPREPLPDEVFLDCKDGYAHLPQKTVAICQWANEHDVDYIYKGDDDTAVYVDRLVRELAHTLFDYAGCDHHGVCTGGPGYFLSRRAFRLVATQGGSPDHWAEDVWVSKVLNRNNIYPMLLPGHRAGYTDHWFFPNGYDPTLEPEGVVTMHAIKPDVMRQWHKEKK